MPAHTRVLIRHQCEDPRCSRPAEVEVVNRRNAPVAYACRPHGEAMARSLDAEDRRLDDVKRARLTAEGYSGAELRDRMAEE